MEGTNGAAMTTGTDTLDRKMVNRYIECVLSHPNSHICIRDPHCPDIASKPNFRNVVEGKLTHLMVVKGPLMVTTWVPSYKVQFIMDAYGETV